jgi:hypothetical protein
MTAEVDAMSIQSIDDLCKQWIKLKPLLSVAQSILSVLFPPAAAAIGIVITLFDKICPTPGAGPIAAKP